MHILPELAGRLDGTDAKKSKSSDAVSELEREAASELLSLMLSKIQIGGSCPLNIQSHGCDYKALTSKTSDIQISLF